MKPTVLGHLEQEELSLFRMAAAKIDAMKIKPSAYNPTEIEQAHIRFWQVQADIGRSHGLIDGFWQADLVTGTISESSE